MRCSLVRRRARRSARLPAGFAAAAAGGVSRLARIGGDDSDTPGDDLLFATAAAAAVSRVAVANCLVRVRVRSSPSGATPGQWPAVAEETDAPAAAAAAAAAAWG
jgi:hypothetical protein